MGSHSEPGDAEEQEDDPEGASSSTTEVKALLTGASSNSDGSPVAALCFRMCCAISLSMPSGVTWVPVNKIV